MAKPGMLGEGAIQGRPSAGQRALRRQPPTVQTSSASRQPPRAASRQATSPGVSPCRTGSSKAPTNDSKPGRSHGPSITSPPRGFGRSRNPDLASTSSRGFGCPDRRRHVGVVTRPDVLKVDHEQVQPGEGLGRRPQGGERIPVEREDRHARPGIPALAGRDHVLLDAVVPVLGSEQQRRQLAPGEREVRRFESGAHRRSVGEQGVAAAAQRARLGEQAIEAGGDHPRRKSPEAPPSLPSSRRSVITAERSTALTMS